MLGKDELIKSLQEINDKRLLSSEVTTLLAPFKEVTFPLSLEFISHSRSFGKQKDPIYDGGQTVICKVIDMDIECAALFESEDNDMIEEQNEGDCFELIVRYLDYDSLYQRIIIGKVGSVTGQDEEGINKIDKELTGSVSNGPAIGENEGPADRIDTELEIEAPQRSDNVTVEVQNRKQDASSESKKKKRTLSFRRAISVNPDQGSDQDDGRSTYEGVAEREFKNVVAPILIGVGLIFCLNGISRINEGEGLGAFFVGLILAGVGLYLKIINIKK
ncbi:MAG: hypothetical protein OSB44_02435 [Verrucomicrobiales bacterium]|nr:hypothetical protein [Verrucomicrobiales bacterium]